MRYTITLEKEGGGGIYRKVDLEEGDLEAKGRIIESMMETLNHE